MKYCLLIAASLLAGCALDSVSQIDLALPAKEFSIDASRWQLDPAEVPAYLGTACETQTACTLLAKDACDGHCTGTCDETNRCALILDVSLYSAVDLVMERPELRAIDDQPLIDVSIDGVTYDVTQSSLNIATPPLTVYVAPASVTDPDDAAAIPVGTIPALAPGALVSGAALELTPAGRVELARIMGTYKTPFNVMVAATVTVGAGDALPEGRLDAVVNIRAHASL